MRTRYNRVAIDYLAGRVGPISDADDIENDGTGIAEREDGALAPTEAACSAESEELGRVASCARLSKVKRDGKRGGSVEHRRFTRSDWAFLPGAAMFADGSAPFITDMFMGTDRRP